MIQDLLTIKNDFVSELEGANSGAKTSLPFIVHEIPEFSIVEDKEVFQVIIIGGTYGVSAQVEKQGDTCKILSQKKITLPLLSNKESLFLLIDQLFLDETRVLVINFAFGISPFFEHGKLDGRLMVGAKGHAFRGLIDKKIGAEVEQFILEKRNKKILVSVANDTVCLLLSGLEKTTSRNLAAGVVGSGVNFAFFLDQNKLVNLESGNFNKFPLSSEAEDIDSESASPGTYLYEKEVAGVYLYKKFNIHLRHAHMPHPAINSSEEMDQLARNETGEVGKLARNLMEHSAGLVACQIAAIMEFRKTDMVFVMEGSLFWKGFEYKKIVEETLEKLTDYKAEFVEIKDSGIIGAAHLVM